jgi:3'-phosphoadenosine 5'-phosphosulfate (PAPS) 3'-phosphatase
MDNLKDLIKPVLSVVKEVGFCLEDVKAEKRFIRKPEDLAKFADNFAHEMLSKLLKKILNILVVSEEDATSHSIVESYYWLIDPIDGTSSYSNGYNGYVVQCALMKNDKPVLSAIYAPHFRKAYHAYAGGGAWVDGTSLTKKICYLDPFRSIVDNEPVPHDISAVIYQKLNFDRYIESGSLGLKMCLVAEGVATAFVKSTIVRDWDVAPASLLLNEIGGNFTDSYSKSIHFAPGNRSHIGLIATRDIKLHDEISNIFAKERVNGRFR